MKHTPGPWSVGWPFAAGEGDELDIVAVNKGGIAFLKVIPTGHANNMEVLRANADLIAAAPDLLEALQAVVDAWNHEGTMLEAERLTLAAIAKAEGRA